MNEVQFYFAYLFFTYFPPRKYDLGIYEIYEIADKYFGIFEELEQNENLSLYDDICDFIRKREGEIEFDLQKKISKKF